MHDKEHISLPNQVIELVKTHAGEIIGFRIVKETGKEKQFEVCLFYQELFLQFANIKGELHIHQTPYPYSFAVPLAEKHPLNHSTITRYDPDNPALRTSIEEEFLEVNGGLVMKRFAGIITQICNLAFSDLNPQNNLEAASEIFQSECANRQADCKEINLLKTLEVISKLTGELLEGKIRTAVKWRKRAFFHLERSSHPLSHSDPIQESLITILCPAYKPGNQAVADAMYESRDKIPESILKTAKRAVGAKSSQITGITKTELIPISTKPKVNKKSGPVTGIGRE